jgi:hypothetical protein
MVGSGGMTSDPDADDGARALSAALLTLAARDQRTPCQGRYGALFLSEHFTRRAAAIPMCTGCDLITKCADYAAELKASFGVWAGVDRTPSTRTTPNPPKEK